MTAYRRPIRHAAPDADDLPGVRAQPPLLAASADGMQAESAICPATGAAGEQAGLPEPELGNLPHLPHASGNYSRNLLRCSVRNYHYGVFLMLTADVRA